MQVLHGLEQFEDSNLLVGSGTSDDAAIYRIAPDLALVQTVDFFTPIVDDPYLYGQIAATNSLSDIYAMGGRPITAMNIVGMPADILSVEIINPPGSPRSSPSPNFPKRGNRRSMPRSFHR